MERYKSLFSEGSYEDILSIEGGNIRYLIQVVNDFIEKLYSGNDDIEQKLSDIGYFNVINRYDKWGNYIDNLIGDGSKLSISDELPNIAKWFTQNPGYEARANIGYIANELEMLSKKLR